MNGFIVNTQHKEFSELFATIARLWRLRLDARLREDKTLAPYNLSMAKWRVLLCLQRNPDGLSQRELADQVGVEGPTMVGMIDRLEADGLVERQASPLDRRTKIVRLQAAGIALVPAIEAHAQAVRSEVLGGIAEQDLERCHHVLITMRNALQTPATRTEG